MYTISNEHMSSDSLSSTHMDKSRRGRKGDPRMYKALCAKLEDPSLSLFEALVLGGFDYPSDRNPYAVDGDSVTLSQRKNQLSRRLRLAKKQEQEEMENAKRPRDATTDGLPEKPSLRRSALSAGAREQMEKLMRHSEDTLDRLARPQSESSKRARFDRSSSCPDTSASQANQSFLPILKPPKRRIESFRLRRETPASVRSAYDGGLGLGCSSRPTKSATTNPFMDMAKDLLEPTLAASERSTHGGFGLGSCARPPKSAMTNPFMDMAKDLLEPSYDVVPRFNSMGNRRATTWDLEATESKPTTLPKERKNPFLEMAHQETALEEPDFAVAPFIFQDKNESMQATCIHSRVRKLSICSNDPFLDKIEELGFDLDEEDVDTLSQLSPPRSEDDDSDFNPLDLQESMDSIDSYFEENVLLEGIDVMLE